MKSKVLMFAAAGTLGIPGAVLAQDQSPSRADVIACELLDVGCELIEEFNSREQATLEGEESRAMLRTGSEILRQRSASATSTRPETRSAGAAPSARAARPRVTNRVAAPVVGTGAFKVDSEVKNSIGNKSALFVTFKLGSAELTDDAESEIAALAEAIAKGDAAGNVARIQIAGHTDSTGLAERNQELSAERAAAVKDALVAAGVDPQRLESVGYGSSKPIEGYRSSHGINRRVEAVVID